jgi:hypothetical protein
MAQSLSEFCSCGFLITRSVPRPCYVSAELLPERIASVSTCISKFVPDTWCIEWTGDSQESRLEDARAFDLDLEVLRKVTDWVTPRFGGLIGWPNIVFDLGTARQLVEQFLGELDDIKVLELGLHKSLIEAFCDEAEPSPQQPGFAPIGRQGIHEAVLKRRPLALGGCIQGFEPLVFDGSLSHSWLCNSLETSVSKHLDIRPNSFGMIDQFEEARACVEYISRDEVGAEPGLWLPWLIIEHPTKAQRSGAPDQDPCRQI